MYERFTDRSRKVMFLAEKEARRLCHDYVGTEHLLMGLIEEGSGVAANVLKNMDVHPSRVRVELEKLFTQTGEATPSSDGRRLTKTPGFEEVIRHAREEAVLLHHNYIGTEHILLGLLRAEYGAGRQVIMSFGISLDDVREEVMNLLGHAEPKTESADGVWKKMPIWRADSAMIPIRLETSDGELIAEEALPPFLTPPEVVKRGQQFFKLHAECVYREAFVYYITGKEKEA